MKNIIYAMLLFVLIIGVYFIPDSYIDKVLNSEKLEGSISDLITVITFLAGFILLILPMKIDASHQKNSIQRQLHIYLIRRNRFLTVLFFLFLIEILLLFLLLFIPKIWLFKFSAILLEILIIAIIRLFFLIREYVEYSE